MPHTTKTNCPTCHVLYDETNATQAEDHTTPIYCSQTHRCGRCHGKPACYFCQSSFCFCTSH
ncbi:hypothetical protein ACIP5N_21370 [Streptomyces sp. NPDC088768]|uniref:hypothetical protein n=1 Tax=Streptomyces sp. NPDC088768 TaxID=3365894 RepID=UPI00381EFF9A